MDLIKVNDFQWVNPDYIVKVERVSNERLKVFIEGGEGGGEVIYTKLTTQELVYGGPIIGTTDFAEFN